MADRRFYYCSVFSFIILRLVFLSGKSHYNKWNSKEVYLHLWKFVKIHHVNKPFIDQGKFNIRSTRDFASSNDKHLVGLLLLCGDISTHPGPLKNINGLYLNSRSIVKKTDEFQALAIGKDLIFCVESWLKPHIMNCELLPSSEFTIHRRDRETRVGGGIFLAVRNSILSLRRADLEGNAEILACELRPDERRKILALVFYRPPDTDLNYLKEFKKSLRLASRANYDQLIILGDFNLPNIDWTTGTATASDCLHNYFTKTVKDNYLWQLIDFPTRGDNILDLVLTTIPTKLRHIHGFDDIISTDHKLISFEIDLKIPPKPKTMRTVYNLKRADWTGLKQTLKCIPWDMCFVPNDIDVSFSNWCDLFISAVNEHIPKCKPRNVNDPPWIDNELLSLLKKKDATRKKLSKYPSPSCKIKYDELRKTAKTMISNKKKEHAEKLKTAISDNPKRFWSYVKTCTSDKLSPSFLMDGHAFLTDSRDKANLLNKFFHSVFNPATAVPPPSYQASVSSEGEKMDSIKLTVPEVTDALMNLDPNKACGPDNIPGSLLKYTAAEIAPSLCNIFNLSLLLGTVPANWKRANISPVFKKQNPTLAENYRPISLLCIVSKVLERCVFNHCILHLTPFFYHLQHGFQRGKSTVTQLLEVYHDILDKLASGQEVDVIHLDLSKAFDKVPHNLLLSKLQLYGVSGSVLQWFTSYLSDRHQRVVLDGIFSDWLPVTSGVPQGSILGPLLFLVYVNDMPSYIVHGSSLALFADDSKLYRPIDSVSSTISLQADLDRLHKWSVDHNMSFNTAKCKVLHMTKRRSRRAPQKSYHLNGETLDSAPSTRDLGVTVTAPLSWAIHIEETCAKGNRVLGLVKRVCGRDISDVATRKLMYTALVRPVLEYASCLWSPYTVKHRRLIENIQRRATKFILNYPDRHINYKERLKRLDLLPLEFRRDVRDLSLLYKIKVGLITANFDHLLLPATSRYATRNYDPANIHPVLSHNQQYYINSFFPRTIKLWNNLPSPIKHANTVNRFKNLLFSLYKDKRKLYVPP